MRFVTRHDVAVHKVDLAPIQAAISKAPNMRHPELSELQRSFQTGRAAAGIDEATGRVVAFVRIFERLNDGVYARLGLNGNLPHIYEIGGGYILKEHRGQHQYGPLRNHLLGSFAEAINAGRVLVLGISNSKRVLSTLPRSQTLGISFGEKPTGEFHDTFAAVVPLLCNCHPEPHDNMEVMLRFEGCPHDPGTNGANGKQKADTVADDKLPSFHAYWSSEVLVSRLDEALGTHFSRMTDNGQTPAQAFREALRGIGYFDRL